MKIVSICKPDLLKKAWAEKDFFKRLEGVDNINSIDVYNLDDWAQRCLYLYEFDCDNLTPLEELKKRKEILITAKSYDLRFKGDNAYLLVIDTDEDKFKEFTDLKKDFRKQYVYHKSSCYIRFHRESEIDFSKKFDENTLSNIEAHTLYYKHEIMEKPYGYYLAYLNMIHFPVTKEENDFEYNVLEGEVINDNNLVRRLKL